MLARKKRRNQFIGNQYHTLLGILLLVVQPLIPHMVLAKLAFRSNVRVSVASLVVSGGNEAIIPPLPFSLDMAPARHPRAPKHIRRL